MNTFLTALRGLLTAVVTGLLVFGAISLSLLETPPVATATQPVLETLAELPTSAPTSQPARPATSTARATMEPSLQPTRTATAACAYPAGWIRYVVKENDTIPSLAVQSGISPAEVRAGNCLGLSPVTAGDILYLPGRPVATATATLTLTATPTPAAPGPAGSPTIPSVCVRPAYWIPYTIQAGDTLSTISQALDVAVEQLLRANCMEADQDVLPGDTLWVPEAPDQSKPASPPSGAGTSTPGPASDIVERAASPTLPSSSPTPLQQVIIITVVPVS